jgi:predicted  nucleic acid-binding Zn ribbon protein
VSQSTCTDSADNVSFSSNIAAMNFNKKGEIIAAKIVVYAGDEEEYLSLITPEAYHELEKWMNYRRESGEAINGNSWVLRNIWYTKQGFKRGFIDSPKN